MKQAYTDLLKHSLVYGVGQLLSRLASFLLLPLYTSCLTPADYGVIAILDVSAGMLTIVIGAGMAAAVNRYHFDAQDEPEQRRVWWSGLTIVVVLASCIVLPIWLSRGFLAEHVLGRGWNGPALLNLVLATIWFSSVGELPDTYLRVRKWSHISVAVSLAQLLINIGLNVYFLTVWKMGVAGILAGNLVTTVVMTLIRLLIFAGRCRFAAIDRETARRLWRFGLPMVGTALLATFMHQGDRWLLKLWLGNDEIGRYSLAATFGQAANSLCLLPFSAIWGVVIYEVAARPDAKVLYTSIFKYFVYLVGLVLFGVSLFADRVVALMTTAEYHAAADLVPIICLAYLLFGLHEHFRVPAYLAKRTVMLLPAFVAGVVVNIAANLVMIPWWGTYGAALASVLTFLAFSFVGLRFYAEIERFDYPFLPCGVAVLGMAASYLVWRYGLAGAVAGVWSFVIPATLWLAWALVLFHAELHCGSQSLLAGWKARRRAREQESSSRELGLAAGEPPTGSKARP